MDSIIDLDFFMQYIYTETQGELIRHRRAPTGKGDHRLIYAWRRRVAY